VGERTRMNALKLPEDLNALNALAHVEKHTSANKVSKQRFTNFLSDVFESLDDVDVAARDICRVLKTQLEIGRLNHGKLIQLTDHWVSDDAVSSYVHATAI
jgi:hypothetical protein